MTLIMEQLAFSVLDLNLYRNRGGNNEPARGDKDFPVMRIFAWTRAKVEDSNKTSKQERNNKEFTVQAERK